MSESCVWGKSKNILTLIHVYQWKVLVGTFLKIELKVSIEKFACILQ